MFNMTPENMALMMGGINMMAASRGGNTDMSKGGLGYALQQGMQGGINGLQIGQSLEKQNQRDEMLKGLDASKLTPEQLTAAKLAIQNGDPKAFQLAVSNTSGTKPTNLMKNAAAMGLVPGTPEYTKFINDAVLKPGTTINMPGSIKAPTKFMIDPKNPNAVKRIPGSEFSQAQMKAAGFANRMTKSQSLMSGLTEKGYDPSNLRDKGADYVPFAGNFAKSDEGQEYTQAQEDWVRAKLRLESGAVIADEEMAKEITTYFPIPGDSAGTIKQKEQARLTAEENLIAESQGAFENMMKNKKPAEKETDDPLGLR